MVQEAIILVARVQSIEYIFGSAQANSLLALELFAMRVGRANEFQARD